MVGSGTESGREEESLPLDIMINILKRVPVKSLLQFKSVSKDWKNIIETPHFTSEHRSHSSSNEILLLHRIPYNRTSSFCLIGPDFEVHSLRYLDFTSPTVKVVGVCNGLVLIKDTNDHKKLSLWNPATTQVKQVTETLIGFNHCPRIGFGFCPIVNDYKIVRISVGKFDHGAGIIHNLDDLRVNRAEVYSLTTGCWREINVVNLQKLHIFSYPSVTADGAIFWLATLNNDIVSNPEFVVSFDIEHEVFTLLKAPPPPPSSPTCSYKILYNILAVYNSKLAMFRHFIMGNCESYRIDFWVMEDARESWSKKCSVGPYMRMIYPLCIWRDEIVCREQYPSEYDDYEYSGVKIVLSLFNPCCNELKIMPVQTYNFHYSAFSYAESLVSFGNIHREL